MISFCGIGGRINACHVRKSALQTTLCDCLAIFTRKLGARWKKAIPRPAVLTIFSCNLWKKRLKRLHRELIDREFEQMKNDRQYQRESEVIAKQFTTSDRETLRVADESKNS